jgi:hypothetical protein
VSTQYNEVKEVVSLRQLAGDDINVFFLNFIIIDISLSSIVASLQSPSEARQG